MKMTYDEARQYIKEASKAGIRPGLSFQFVKRLTRDERRKWGYAGVWEIRRMT